MGYLAVAGRENNQDRGKITPQESKYHRTNIAKPLHSAARHSGGLRSQRTGVHCIERRRKFAGGALRGFLRQERHVLRGLVVRLNRALLEETAGVVAERRNGLHQMGLLSAIECGARKMAERIECSRTGCVF
jgi:hypothetical protein